MKRFGRSLGCALRGVAHVIKTQRNMKIQLAVGVVACIVGFVLHLEAVEWAVISILIGLVIAFETLNTAIETGLDRVSTELHPKTRDAKDSAAGAVLIISLLAAIAGLIIYINAYLRLIA